MKKNQYLMMNNKNGNNINNDIDKNTNIIDNNNFIKNNTILKNDKNNLINKINNFSYGIILFAILFFIFMILLFIIIILKSNKNRNIQIKLKIEGNEIKKVNNRINSQISIDEGNIIDSTDNLRVSQNSISLS